MTLEDQSPDRKSLKAVTGRAANWSEIAKDCVCFANGGGGRLLIGIQDGERLPPADQTLTNLGVLLLGGAVHRRRLGTAPLVQAIKYDERGSKINKWAWDDHILSPVELLDAIWKEIPDFRESYEVAEGLFRRRISAYDEKVVGELLVNALVHRPYTQRGDIYLNLYPDRLEAINPGRLPLGVTPANILHASRRRNDNLARVFHDLGLMEREGSGFDLMYDRLAQARTGRVARGG